MKKMLKDYNLIFDICTSEFEMKFTQIQATRILTFLLELNFV